MKRNKKLDLLYEKIKEQSEKMFFNAIDTQPYSCTSTVSSVENVDNNLEEVFKILKSFKHRRENLLNEAERIIKDLLERYELICSPYIEEDKAYIFKCNDGPFFITDEEQKEKLVVSTKFYHEILKLKHDVEKNRMD